MSRTTTLEPPAPQPPPQTPDSSAGPGPGATRPVASSSPVPSSRWGLEITVVALMMGASLALGRVFVGFGFLRPVLAAIAISLGISIGSRRLGLGPLAALLATAVAWLVFAAVAFVPDTLVAGIVPTPDSIGALRDTWIHGLDLIRLRPSPSLPEPGLMLITITGVWWVAHAVEGLVFRLGAPVRAMIVAMVLWTVPLAIAPQGTGGWPWAVPFLSAAAALLLAFAGTDLDRWGTWIDPWTSRVLSGRRASGYTRNPLAPAGALIAVVAIVAGVVLGGQLPGAGARAWWQVGALGGSTLTTNPIVNLRTNLVTQDTSPVLRVRTPRPVYLRTTSLDVYNEREEWTNSGISGTRVPPLVPYEVPIDQAERFWLDIEVTDLAGAVLVPVPYQPEAVVGPAAEGFRYDPSNATFTLAQGAELSSGDSYSVFVAVPTPSADALDAVPADAFGGRLTALPDNTPPEVGQLARTIVEDAGARTPFEQALAIQNELRSWEYSLEPPPGHSGRAMLSFLENRVGYCEQFAGTMAVMLRTLGVPSRVAVGFSPGELVDPAAGEYVITQANAHAWVEVLFPGLGWIAFEPTPRSDGNVLVPEATNLAPSNTVAQLSPDQPSGPGQGDFPTGDVSPGMDSAQALAQQGGAGGTSSGGGGANRLLWIVAAVLAAAVVVAVIAVRGSRREPTGSPAERVDAALASVARIGRGLGVRPDPWETVREYLARLGADGPAGRTLSDAVVRARYAPVLPAAVGGEAERAAAQVRQDLLAGRSRLARWGIRVRGAVRTTLAIKVWRRRRAQVSTS